MQTNKTWYTEATFSANWKQTDQTIRNVLEQKSCNTDIDKD